MANEFRGRKRFALKTFFEGVEDDASELNIIDVRERVVFQRDDGKKLEIDVLAESSCGRVVVVEVKKTQVKTGLKAVEDFQEKVAAYAQYLQGHAADKVILPAFLSLGGFTDEARRLCEAQGIGMAERIAWRIGE